MKVLVTGNLSKDVPALIQKEHEVVFHPENRPLERDRLLAIVS